MEIVDLAVAGLAVLVVLRGVSRLVRRGRRNRRWLAVPPHYVVREDLERPVWHGVLGALVWFALAGVLVLLTILHFR